MLPLPKGVVKLDELTWETMKAALSSKFPPIPSNIISSSACNKVVVVPQLKGTCWFNAVLMSLFYSEGMRKLLLSKVPAWDAEDAILKVFYDIITKQYTHDNHEYMAYFNDMSPSKILDILHKHAPKTFEMNPLAGQGYFGGRYLYKLWRYMGVTKYAILDAIQQPKSHTYSLYYGQYNTLQMKGVQKIYKQASEAEVEQYLEKIPDVLMIMTKKQADIKFYPDYYYHSDQEFTPILTYNGVEYIVDSLILANYNTSCGGHEIAGVTCNGQRYMYNGWLSTTKDAAMKKQAQNKVPCPLMKYDWTKKTQNFCLDTQKCRLHFGDKAKEEKSDICFNFSRGSRIYTYIRKDLLMPVPKKSAPKPKTPSPPKVVEKPLPPSEVKEVSSPAKKTCPEGKVLNPKTGRCVKKDGKIGQALA